MELPNGQKRYVLAPKSLLRRRRCASESLVTTSINRAEQHLPNKSRGETVANIATMKKKIDKIVDNFKGVTAVNGVNHVSALTKHCAEPEIIDIKDVYLLSAKNGERHNDLTISRHIERLNDVYPRAEGGGGRARSESEPPELYMSNRVSLKRTRDTISPPLDTTKHTTTNSKQHSLSKESSSAPLARVSSPPNYRINGQKANVMKLRSSPSLRRSPLLRKSATPPCRPSVSSSSSMTKSKKEDEVSDTEGGENSSLEDEDDSDLAPGEGEGSITDSEDNYRVHLTAKNLEIRKTASAEVMNRKPLSAPLAPSLFPNCPPYITFATHTEKGPNMPAAIQKILKWKLTTITPIVIRRVLINSGFRLLRKTNDWMGTWGKHMKSPCFKTLRPHQKFNHLPGSFQIGRKDRVWRNLQNLMVRHGKKEFGFMPRTFILPQDLKTLRQVWPKYAQNNAKWIVKPCASARGTGIKVVNRWSQISKRKPLIVQRYIERPLLINGSKFDLRLYALVTSINPLRVFLHTDGLARFASVKYSEHTDTLSDRYMHLTNYSINKLSANYSSNDDAQACQGHKWTVKSLWFYLSDKGFNVDLLWSALRNLVLRTILAGEGPINAMLKRNVSSRYNCFELFGIDVLLDSELIPWLLEVNISPSLHSASPLDAHVKGPLVTALLNTVMYQIPPKLSLEEQNELLVELNLENQASQLCFDKRIYCTALTKVERHKHNQFAIKDLAREDYLNAMLSNLTPDDIRCLLLTEDEFARSSPLERIFPTNTSYHYLAFTDCPRYYNRLLDAWETRYAGKHEEGIELLRSFCEQNVHLEVPPQTFQKDSNDDGFIIEESEEPTATETKYEEIPTIGKTSKSALLLNGNLIAEPIIEVDEQTTVGTMPIDESAATTAQNKTT